MSPTDSVAEIQPVFKTPGLGPGIGLPVERLELRRPARHKEENNIFGFFRGALRGGLCQQLFIQQGSQRQRPKADAGLLEEISSSYLLQGIRGYIHP